MKFKNISFILIVSIIIGLFSTTIVIASDSEYVDPEIPESWYESPKTASGEGISEFNQSPLLDERVEQGELPPVEERLPEDPPVIEPYEEIGQYGGTANVWNISLNSGLDAAFVGNVAPAAGQPSPNGDKMKPYYLKGWDFSDDAKEITLYLREGVKYSDGTLFTAEDYLYWWEYNANNEELSPVSPSEWSNSLLDVEKIDDYTIKFIYQNPNPRAADFNFQNGIGPDIWGDLPPADFMKNFHPDFVGVEKVEKMAEEVGLETWDEYYGRIRNDSPDHPEYEYQRPVLTPYVAVERTETTLILERNPYYPFVDTKGNQLPYIDKIRVNLANSDEMVRTKSVTGEASLSARHTIFKDVPLYSRNEEKGNYQTLLYTTPYSPEVGINVNMTHQDSQMRELFQDVRFRRALSYAIDRDDINQKVYFGRGLPMQATVPPINSFYKEEYSRAYAEYNPEKAEELLDEIGLVDKDDNGYRDLPDGETFNPTLLYTPSGMDPTPVLEMLVSDFADIGININIKNVSRELHDQRRQGNNFDIGQTPVNVMTDLTFGDPWHLPKSFAATAGDPAWTSFPGWVNWNATDGEEGMELSEVMKEIVEYADIFVTSPDEEERMEAGEKLVKAQAENLWTIGTVGMVPQPVIASKNLKNIPETGIWDWGTRYMRPYNPVQFYLKD